MHSNKVLKVIKNYTFKITAYQEQKTEEITKKFASHSYLFDSDLYIFKFEHLALLNFGFI